MWYHKVFESLFKKYISLIINQDDGGLHNLKLMHALYIRSACTVCA
jgi:hypothetical protein